MDKRSSFQEWVQFAKMDLDTAKHLIFDWLEKI